ncbi:hypothetical protein H0E87_009564, partial [Populus deltoides]
VQGAVFDLPEEIAKELLNKQIPPGNTIAKITKLPALQDDGPQEVVEILMMEERYRRGGEVTVMRIVGPRYREAVEMIG